MKTVLKRGLICSLIFTAIGFFLFCAFISGAKTQSEKLVSSENASAGLRVSLQIEKSNYPLSAPIPLHLIISNTTSNEDIQLNFGTSQFYDFIITQEEKTLWYWSKDKAFAMMMEEIILTPGESLSYREVWDQHTSEGELISPGRYTITAVLKTVPEIAGEPQSVEITAALSAL